MLPLGAATLATDGSFSGLLSAYGWAHRAGELPADVVLAERPGSGLLFGAPVLVETDAALAERVQRGLEREKAGIVGTLFRAFLSERPGMEVAILRVIDAVAAEGAEVVSDWTFEPTREVRTWAKRVGREAHRQEAFVRFEKHEPEAPPLARTGDVTAGAPLWLATARPEVHVLPLIGDHFATRYPALRWAIVDDRRGLALVHATPAAERAPDEPATRVVPAATLGALRPTDDEAAYQRMWRAYFRAVDIPERKNLQLHLRHVPRRYWPYLTEKRAESGATPGSPATP